MRRLLDPEIYIAVGISGAIQRVAGMKGFKTIVTIRHPRPDLPELRRGSLVQDLFKAVPELLEKI